MNETHAEGNGEEENERVWHGEEEEEEEEGHLRGNVAAVTDESSVDKLRHQQVAKQHFVPVGFAEMVDNPKKKKSRLLGRGTSKSLRYRSSQLRQTKP